MPITPSKSVLLVRDDELLREYLCKMPGDAGLQVAEATNAVKILDRMIADEDSDVLVTDIHDVRSWDEWPCIDSAARLRWPEFYAVLMSGNDIAKLATHPGDQFLSKPFNMDTLIQAGTELGAEPILSNCRTAFGA